MQCTWSLYPYILFNKNLFFLEVTLKSLLWGVNAWFSWWFVLVISKLNCHFFLIWNHDVYQSFQVAVKFVMLFMLPNNVSNCLLFLWQFSWGTAFWHFNVQCDTLYSHLRHLHNYDLYTFREMWGYKTNGRKELAGWSYLYDRRD